MALLILILLPIAEIWMLFRVGGAIGGFNTFMLLLVMGILGAGLARAQGRNLLMQAQSQVARGEVPSGAALHGILIFFGGIMMLVPGFITDVIGLLFVLPGPRHLIAKFAQRRWAQQMQAGRFRVFTAGGFGGAGGGFPGGGPFGRGPFGSAPEWPDRGTEGQRDVSPKVIDVTPVRSSRTDGGDGGTTEG